jgi:hypothetical protein
MILKLHFGQVMSVILNSAFLRKYTKQVTSAEQAPILYFHKQVKVIWAVQYFYITRQVMSMRKYSKLTSKDEYKSHLPTRNVYTVHCISEDKHETSYLCGRGLNYVFYGQTHD